MTNYVHHVWGCRITGEHSTWNLKKNHFTKFHRFLTRFGGGGGEGVGRGIGSDTSIKFVSRTKVFPRKIINFIFSFLSLYDYKWHFLKSKGKINREKASGSIIVVSCRRVRRVQYDLGPMVSLTFKYVFSIFCIESNNWKLGWNDVTMRLEFVRYCRMSEF